MKKIVAVLIIFSISSVFSQQINMNSGFNITTFFDFSSLNNDPHEESNFNSGIGYATEISLSDFLKNSRLTRFTLGFEQVVGYFYNAYIGLGSSSFNTANINKNFFTLSSTFVNIKFLKNFQWGMGVKLCFLVNDNSKSLSFSRGMGYASYHSEKDFNTNFSNIFSLCFESTLEYNISLTSQWFLSPKHCFNLVLLEKDPENSPKSIRQYFLLGIGLKI